MKITILILILFQGGGLGGISVGGGRLASKAAHKSLGSPDIPVASHKALPQVAR